MYMYDTYNTLGWVEGIVGIKQICIICMYKYNTLGLQRLRAKGFLFKKKREKKRERDLNLLYIRLNSD